MRDTVEVLYEMSGGQIVTYEGEIYSMFQYATIKLSCSVDMSNFPFDTQRCPIVLVPPNGHDKHYSLSKYSF